MSACSWGCEFYFVPATWNFEDQEEVVAHSLIKWFGLQPDRLAAHGLRLANNEVVEIDEKDSRFENVVLTVDSRTCSLCQRYYRNLNTTDESPCIDCPLYQHLGHACDDDDGDSDSESLYSEALRDPAKMVAALCHLIF